MLTWTGILLAVTKLLPDDNTPYVAIQGLYASISGGILSIFFLVGDICTCLYVGKQGEGVEVEVEEGVEWE